MLSRADTKGVNGSNLQAIHNIRPSSVLPNTGVSAYNLQVIYSQQVKDLFSVAKVRIIYDTTKDKEQKKEPPHH